MVGKRWFCRNVLKLKDKEEFLVARESVQARGQGTTLETLPRPWDHVTIFLKKYVTYEGRYHVIYAYYFVFLSHLRHGILINIPYYLMKTLENMAHYEWRA